MSKLSEILPPANNWVKLTEKGHKELEAAINAYIAEVIGEDEKPRKTADYWHWPVAQRNELRAEQRKRAGL